MTNSYDFEKDLFENWEEDINQDDDPRTNLRIVKCCGNCKFFWYENAKERRGYCRLPNPNKKKYNIDKEKAKKEWIKTHTTNVCDLHQFSGKHYSFDRVSKWVGKKFNLDGTIDENE